MELCCICRFHDIIFLKINNEAGKDSESWLLQIDGHFSLVTFVLILLKKDATVAKASLKLVIAQAPIVKF
jgi:hypothetical protein